MKHIIHSLFECRFQSPSLVVAKGVGGEIHIQFFSSEIVKVSYQFDQLSINETFSKASDYITSPSKTLFMDEVIVLKEEPQAFILTCAQCRVVVEKRYALISIWYEGILQHGGRVGTADTVLPSYQVRCFTKEGSPDSFSRFNFPLLEDDEFYGLGDKSGFPNRRGRRFSMYNRDSLGYDASNSDPLYKSIPFMIKRNTQTGALCGLLFDQSLIKLFDLGRESPFFFSVEVEGGPYSYFTFLGRTYHQVLKNYCKVTGFPAFPPLFSFGFFGSSMNYAEPDDAEQRILQYFATIEEHKIPCEGMYVSSGYLKSPEGKRYAFLWNKQKFPDHKAFLTSLSERGYNLCMNIKPGILTSHPWYGELKEKGYFIKDQSGQPYQEFFWGGEASFIDFSNPDAKAWWKCQLKAQYLDHGCTGIWNDNNELELEDVQLGAFKTKTLYPIWMAEASYEAFKQQQPDRRPWIYSRSGYAGMQRFARTWSGDNVSDWKTLKYNQYMGLGFGLSGLPYFGHDLGGFFGAFPEEELLVRSAQSAVFQGRFVIHSWREDGNPTEPWSYKSALPHIRSLILEHYRFMPYLYTCAFEAATEGKPIERSLYLEFPDDTKLRGDELNTLFGPNILKVLVTEKGKNSADVYLPQGVWWYSKEGIAYEGGTSLRLSYPADGQVLYFAKEGSVLPTAPGLMHLQSGLFEHVELLVHPCITENEVVSSYFEDDGSTELATKGYNRWEFKVTDHSLVITKLVGTLEKKRTFTLKVPQGYVVSQQSFDPEALGEGESLVIAISK
ncbi:TIM-barrel domain-containing protein [Sphaerochaeta globosa]|uniref:Glycoside hydrolase family 31 n=1 Tax=Sphaerochaeta globosa (strain ATCC BAA-1886 / DSM 22777 / Buddy) TaxID=158189 RepID=F0RXV8_SPHGB|nr:TIM-barrel domain-containing protein [Sphaerochaeta globosa]ADY12235.1 glycoside hydrolase family 31 [Sphaerochaeta globosa str. Buddy]